MAGIRRYLDPILLTLAALSLAPRPACAQSLEQLVGMPIVNVRIASETPVAAGDLPLLATRPGTRLDLYALGDDLQRLVDSQRFADVRWYALLPDGGGVEVVFDVIDLRSRPPVVRMQSPDPWGDQPGPRPAEEIPKPRDPETGQQVIDVRIEGNDVISRQKIQSQIHTRAERPFDREVMNEDVRRLVRSRMFLDVKGRALQAAGGGVVVTFTVVERSLLKQVQFLGNRQLSVKDLTKEADLKIGAPLDPYTIDDARQRLEAMYQKKGINNTTIEVLEGNQPGDRRAVFLINEGVKQKIWWVTFEGNTIASDARLRTQIQSKPPILWLFKGYVEREKIEADIDKLTAYYRSLGYFSARVGRELEWNEKESWLTLRFVIDEGPRYKIRNVEITGNLKFSKEELTKELQLKPGDYFDQPKMNADVVSIQDVYGAKGYIFANVQPDPRFHEEPGQLDLVYSLEEGKRYRVGRIDVKISGEHPHTRIRTVLNRMSLRPGEIVDTRELRASERRLKASQLFNVDPTKGVSPKIVLVPQDDPDGLANKPRKSPAARSQSPDPPPMFAPPPVQNPPAQNPPPIIRGQSPDQPSRLQWRPERPAPQQPPPARAPYQSRYSPSVVRGQSPSPNPWIGYPGYQGQPVNPYPANAPPPAAPGGYAPPRSSQPPQYYMPPAAPSGQFGGPPPQPGLGPTYGNSVAPGVPIEELSPAPNLQPFIEQDSWVDVQPNVEEARTGRLMFGVGVNSDAGVVGNVVLEEQNFDIARLPTSWYDIQSGVAFRGAGQRFRIEAVPGTQVQRYMFNFSEPYLFDTPVSFGASAFIFDRRFRDWTESRLGGRVSLGYQLTPDMSVTLSQSAEDVEVHAPRLPTPPEVLEVLGHTDLFKTRLALMHDTRDNVFLPTEGHLIELGVEQAFGEFDFPRATAEIRQFFLLKQRADGSGRHVVGASLMAGFSGSNTPVMENFFIGGTTTLRGFRFRGASPQTLGTIVGGEFELLGCVEYLMPLTADDALRAVFFCDFGTVERNIELHAENFRVAPGFGLRISVPALGPAPIALDLAFPVAHADGDQIQNFSFRVGLFR